MRSSKIKGPIPGSVPYIKAFGTPTTDDLYVLEVTTGGPGGTAEITISSDLDDGVAAATVSSGSPIDLGTGGGKVVIVFDFLSEGDKWTVSTRASGVIEQPMGVQTNSSGQIASAGVGLDSGLLTRGAPSAAAQIIASGESKAADSFDMAGCKGLMIRMPSAWTAADIGFETALFDGGSFQPLYAGGSRVTVATDASRDVAVVGDDLDALKAAFAVKLVSLDTGDGSAENQGAERVLIVTKAG